MKFVVFDNSIINVERVAYLTNYGADRTYIHFSGVDRDGVSVEGTMHEVLAKLTGTSDE